MPRFLIDVNLPYRFSLWHDESYIHQSDIDPRWTDKQIWDFAKNEGLTIITKDSDFSNRILLSSPPPKVIHIRFGNMKMKDFHDHLVKFWPDIIEMNEQCKLVNVHKNGLEGLE